jgi:hypothetical protein
MKVTEVTVAAKYSLDTGHGWKAIEVGATASLTAPGETLEVAQQELYARLSRQLKTLWANGSGTASQDAPEGHQEPVQASNPHNNPGGGLLSPALSVVEGAAKDQPAHFCSEHSQEFKKRTGQYGEFWSHQIKGTRNQWCNEKGLRKWPSTPASSIASKVNSNAKI